MPASSRAPLTSATLVGSSWRLRSCCCPVTVTRSAKDISRGMLMRTSPALPTVISIVRSVNPRPSTVSRWSPSGSVSKRKEPAASLVVSRISPLARVRITSAPGTRRPWGSVTSPTISAFAAAKAVSDDGATRASGDAGSRRAPSAAAPIERQRGTKRNMAETSAGKTTPHRLPQRAWQDAGRKLPAVRTFLRLWAVRRHSQGTSNDRETAGGQLPLPGVPPRQTPWVS